MACGRVAGRQDHLLQVGTLVLPLRTCGQDLEAGLPPPPPRIQRQNPGQGVVFRASEAVCTRTEQDCEGEL